DVEVDDAGEQRLLPRRRPGRGRGHDEGVRIGVGGQHPWARPGHQLGHDDAEAGLGAGPGHVRLPHFGHPQPRKCLFDDDVTVLGPHPQHPAGDAAGELLDVERHGRLDAVATEQEGDVSIRLELVHADSCEGPGSACAGAPRARDTWFAASMTWGARAKASGKERWTAGAETLTAPMTNPTWSKTGAARQRTPSRSSSSSMAKPCSRTHASSRCSRSGSVM